MIRSCFFQQFTIDSNAFTMELVDPDLAISALDIGQRVGFSWLDEVAINQYYDCGGTCSITCENGGYVRQQNGQCSCVCPPGLGQYYYHHVIKHQASRAQ